MVYWMWWCISSTDHRRKASITKKNQKEKKNVHRLKQFRSYYRKNSATHTHTKSTYYLMCHTFILYYAFPFVRFPHIDSSPEMKKAITMKEKFFDNSFRLIDAAYLTISSSFFPFPLGRTQQTEHLAFHNNSILGPLSQELDYRIKKKEENLLFKSTHRRNIRAKTHTHTHIPRNLDRNVRATFSLSMKHRATHLNFWNKKREREKKAHDEKLMTEAANEQMNKKKRRKHTRLECRLSTPSLSARNIQVM